MPLQQHTLRGFSIPEVALSVFILSVGLMSIVALMAGSLRMSLANNDAIIAAGLAQEGIELVRNVRDNDFAAGNDGFTSFGNNNAGNSDKEHCNIDWNDPDDNITCFNNRGPDARYYLRYSNGMYQHANGGGGERFSRYIYIDFNNNGGDKWALVRSIVFWGGFETSNFGIDGSITQCTTNNNCVFTDTFLTAWE